MEPKTLDIVDLIERNPITRISNDCNEKMIQKVRDNFTDIQQQLFISSFYCYLNYDQTKDFVVDLDKVWGWMGFSYKHKAKSMLINNFTLDKDYNVLTTHKVGQKNDDSSSEYEKEKKENRGGHNKQTILMTIQTFKRFCLRAGTKKASEIQEYYLKLENLIHDVLQEESSELKQKLQLEQQKLQSEKNNTSKRIHNNILECYQNKNIVYLCELKEHNGKIIVKIGSSQNIKERMANIKNKYKIEPSLLYVLECRDHVKFERFLHNNDTIRSLYINMDETSNTDIKSRETYLVTREQCDIIIKLIKDLYQEYSKKNKEDESIDIDKQIQLLQLKNESDKLSIRLLELKEQKEQRLQLEEKKYENIIKKYEKEEAEKIKTLELEHPAAAQPPPTIEYIHP